MSIKLNLVFICENFHMFGMQITIVMSSVLVLIVYYFVMILKNKYELTVRCYQKNLWYVKDKCNKN